MSAPTTILPLPDVSPDVLAFAQEQGAATYLPGVLAMTRRIFPTSPMRVFLEDDPEIADDWHIVLGVQVPAESGVDELVATHQQWSRDIFEHCPAKYVCVFRLGVTPSA